jgi:hypothetical protein
VYRRPRRRPWRGWLAAIVAAAVLGLAAFGLVKLLSSAPNLDRDAVMLPTSDPNGVFSWKNGVLCVEGSKLYCMDLTKSNDPWQTDLPVDNMKAARSGDYIVAWGGKQVVLIDANGTVKYRLGTNGDVVLAAPGLTTYAVATKEEGQHRLRFYSIKDGSPMDELPFSYENVMGMGYFGDKMNQIWILTVDSNSTHPVTKLTLYVPGKNSTGKTIGSISLTDELAYAAFIESKMTYVVSTHTLTNWENTSTKSGSKLIYGWTLQDALEDGNGRVSFLFAPSGGGETSGQISALWYISSTGAEYRIPLPAGCIRAMLKSNGRICVVTKNGVYSMAQNGSGSRFYPISSEIDSIPAVVPGQAIVVQENHKNFLLNMP